MARITEVADEPTSHRTAPAATTCPVAWCPMCLAVSAVQPLAPEVVGHVLKAGAELFQAFRAIVDARGEGLDGEERPTPVRLEKIDIG